MTNKGGFRFFCAVLLMLAIFCSASSARDGDYPEEEETADSCARTCLATLTAGISSGAAFLGFATCSAGVCPVFVATGASGLLTVSGLGTTISALASTAGDACAEGFSLPCLGYVAVPVIFAGLLRLLCRNQPRDQAPLSWQSH